MGAMLSLRRTRTAPSNMYEIKCSESDGESEETESTAACTSSDEDDSNLLAIAPPNPDALCRGATFDPFESAFAPMLQAAPWMAPQHGGEQGQSLMIDEGTKSTWMEPPLVFQVPLTLTPPSMITDAFGSFQPQTVSFNHGVDGVTSVMWTVDGRKLRNSDRVAVSPLFQLSDGFVESTPLPFKMIISPSAGVDGKGGASFRKSNGKGCIQLKCEAPRECGTNSPLTFWLSVSSGRPDNPLLQQPRGPVTEDFTRSGMCGLPKENEVWNFPASVDDAPRPLLCASRCSHRGTPGALTFGLRSGTSLR